MQWETRLSELRDAREAVIEPVWRFTWRPRLSHFGDTYGRRDRVNSEMNLEAVIERVLR
jgi:hypothetical protein